MKKKNNNIEKYLFIFSLFITLLIGVSLLYNFDFKNNYNLLFDSDTKRIIGDASSYYFSHYRSIVHPLFILIVQPLCIILNGLTQDRILSLIILSSFATSTTVILIYKILSKIKYSPKENVLISLIYLFSFGNVIFTAGVETYNFAVLFIVLLWYYYIKINNNNKYNNYTYILLILLGISTAAITVTNFILFFIILGLLFLNKNLSIKKIIVISIITIVSILSLNVFQHEIWKSAPLMWKSNIKSEKQYTNKNNIKLQNIENVIKNDYYNSILSSNFKIKVIKNNFYSGDNYVITFNKTNIINIILISMLYIITIILIVRNYKKNKLLNLGLLATLLFNTSLHIIYGNNSTFIYCLHFLYVIILLLGINLISETNKNIKKYTNIFLIVFLIFQIINNCIFFRKVLLIVKDILDGNILVNKLGLSFTIIIEAILIFIIIFAFIIIFNIKNMINKKNSKEKNIVLYISMISILVFVELLLNFMFVYKEKDKLAKEVEIENGKIPNKVGDKTYYLNNTFKKHFKNELNSLDEYKNEYLKFTNTYLPGKYKTELLSYYFGFASRRKLIYKSSTLIDVETKEILYEFDEDEMMIIPNIYTVIIQTKNNEFIKIYEDEEGVHYNKNGKDKIIDGTNKKISLYNFDNQEYTNMKKVLYGEILFNIKDSKIYPNIIVYDKPWYRDAAITSMVLRQTSNEDLIIDWINNISEIFDKNNGIEEPDNLGELLYLLSLQENRNNELIKKIENKAEEIANSNPNGYYLYGQTDFSNQYLYQNLWYKFGLESIGKNYHFDLDSIEEDEYSKGAWWSDYKTKVFFNDNQNSDYPYLAYAIRHKQKIGKIVIGSELYPLSWEKNASHANYNNYSGIDYTMQEGKMSALHTWSASELLLYIMDETNDLNYDKLK